MNSSQPQTTAQVLSSSGAKVAYLFGSRATGESRDDSDADVAVLGITELGLLDRAKIASSLAGALSAPEVDLVILEEAPLELRGRIVQEGRLIFSADQSARVEFEVRTRSEYFDFLSTLEEHRRAYLHRVAQRGLS